ncbi:MAG: class I SAM-dependent methyltransferase [Anaerolineae bacterium]
MIEIGVGTGRIALPVAPFVRHYVGVDLSTAMMRLLDKRTAEPVSVIHGDATRLPLPEPCFRRSGSFAHLPFDSTYQQALAELARTLKPQSRLVHCWTKKDQAVDVESIMKQIFPMAVTAGGPMR